MKKLLLLFSTLALSFPTLADNHHLRDFSLSEFCYEQPNVQYRDGAYYLPNQSAGITAPSICVYKDAYGQYSSKGNIVRGYFDGLWTGWERNGKVWLETYYINRTVVPIVCREDLLDFDNDETYYDSYDNPFTGYNRCRNEKNKTRITGEIINGKREGSWSVYIPSSKDFINANYLNGKFNGEVEKGYYGDSSNNDSFVEVITTSNETFKDGELVLSGIELQDEVDKILRSLNNDLRASDKESKLRSAYINNIAARVRTFWRYQGAGYDWAAKVYVAQDRDGKVLAVDIRNTNVSDSSKAKAFINSIERAVYKASPLPAAPDDSVFNEQIIFTFSVK